MNFYFTDLEKMAQGKQLTWRSHTDISNKLTEAASTETAQG